LVTRLELGPKCDAFGPGCANADDAAPPAAMDSAAARITAAPLVLIALALIFRLLVGMGLIGGDGTEPGCKADDGEMTSR
jgi:hypothetical protein